ncbi:MAG: glycosyltransferase [Pseudomonadota bacterium]
MSDRDPAVAADVPSVGYETAAEETGRSPAVGESARRHILFAINSLAGGGAERVFATLLAMPVPDAERFRVEAALLDGEPEAYRLPDHIPVHRLDCRHGLVRSVRRMTGLAKRQRVDLIVAFLTRTNVAAAFAARLSSRPFIVSERVDTSAHLATGRFAWISRWLVRLTYRRAAAIIAVSKGVADTLVRDFGIDRSRISVIFNPVDTKRIEARAAEPPAFPVRRDDCLAMGRLVPNKNFALAIEAFARSGRSGRLVIIGEGPLRDALRALGDSHGLGERLVLPGFVENPYAILARGGLFILSSNAEGFPNALVEALALGIPAVATDCKSGPAEILETRVRDAATGFAEGEGGLLVRPNDVAAMAAAIAQMEDVALRLTLAANGPERVAAFSPERAADRYWRVIETALADARPG